MPEIVVLFDHDEEDDITRTERAQSYCVFWEDRFGVVHFTAYPEDRWEAIMDRVGDPGGPEGTEPDEHDRQGRR